MESLDRKTLQQWFEEVRRQSQTFRDKYEKSLYKPDISRKAPFFRQLSATYCSLTELLNHIRMYGSATDRRCLACQFNEPHRMKLEKDFIKFKHLIARTKDGKDICKGLS